MCVPCKKKRKFNKVSNTNNIVKKKFSKTISKNNNIFSIKPSNPNFKRI